MSRAPDPAAFRRDRKDDPAWTRLEPRDPDAVAPDFPLDSPTVRDLHWWREAWKLPQAAQWEANNEHAAVALYARLMARAEAPDSPVTLMRPLQQLREELGISVTGLRRRRWHLPAEQVAGNRPTATVTPLRNGRPSARERFSIRNNFRVAPMRELLDVRPIADSTDEETS